MNEVQRAAIERADRMMKPALELYEERNKLAHLYYRLNLADLKRLNGLLRDLSDQDLREIFDYAEGIALWNRPVRQSDDAAPLPPRPATAAP